MSDNELLEACGGVPVTTGGEAAWDFGMRPSDPADTAAATVPFDAGEDVPEIAGDKVFLWEYPKAANGGKHPAYNFQRTGSCVHGGCLNVLITRIGVECVCLPEAEAFVTPFALGAYGYSRHLNTWTSPGEGSTGDAMARAVAEMGVVPIHDPDAPKPTYAGPAFFYPKEVEYKFSAFKNCPPGIRERSKAHTAAFAVVKTLDEAEKELRRGRPLTVAGNWGGRIQCGYRGTGANRVLWNGEQADTWQHQQAILGAWHHPEFGRLWYWLNQWYMLVNGVAVSVHGKSANGEPEGGYWTDDRALQHQLSYRFGEVRSFKGFRGFSGELNFGRI